MTEETADTDEAPVPEPRQRGRGVAFGLALVFGLLAIVMGVLLATGRDEDKADRDEIFRLSGELTESLFSFDFANPDGSREAVLEHATESFGDQFETDIAELLGAAAELQLRMEPKIEDLFVSQIDGGTAGAVVVIDIGTTTESGAVQLLDDVYVELTLLKIDGTWKVDDVTYTLADDSVLGTGGTGSTTTSVP